MYTLCTGIKKRSNHPVRQLLLQPVVATEFVIPERVFFWIFLTAWATAETSLEMHYLLDCGYKIPLFKNNKNIILNEIPDGDGLVDNSWKC